jgi:hypothetical protein
MFVGSLIISAILSVFSAPFIWVGVLLLSFYILIILAVGTNLSLRSNQQPFYLILSFIILHFSYGWGSMVGLYQLLIRQITD